MVVNRWGGSRSKFSNTSAEVSSPPFWWMLEYFQMSSVASASTIDFDFPLSQTCSSFCFTCPGQCPGPLSFKADHSPVASEYSAGHRCLVPLLLAEAASHPDTSPKSWPTVADLPHDVGPHGHLRAPGKPRAQVRSSDRKKTIW